MFIYCLMWFWNCTGLFSHKSAYLSFIKSAVHLASNALNDIKFNSFCKMNKKNMIYNWTVAVSSPGKQAPTPPASPSPTAATHLLLLL